MIGDSLPIRAERLIRGDIVLWGGATWQVRLAEPTSLTELEIVLEYAHGDQDDHSDLRTVVSRDSKFRVLLLA
mgnify:CR=1 FL=1